MTPINVPQTPTADNSSGVQLPQADVAKATQPGLFDNLPNSAFTAYHRALIDARPADRMLLCLSLDVSPSAVKVAVALAYHGWSSWPSRETLCRLTDLKSPNVSRACKELEDAGVITRQRRYHRGGNVGIQYTFNGPAMVAAAAEQAHPTLGDAIINLVSAESDANAAMASEQPGELLRDYQFDNGAIINLVSAESDANAAMASEQPGELLRDYQFDNGAIINLVSAESDANAAVVSEQVGEPLRDYQFDNGAIINLIPEPEYRTGIEGLTDIYQSNSGSGDLTSNVPGDSDARARKICPSCGQHEFGPSACANCGLVITLPDERPKLADLPAWYREMARRVDASILPDFGEIDEARMLAGWSATVMRQAAERYVQHYAGQRVNAPGTLFRKLAIDIASGQQRAPSERRSRYGADFQRRRRS